MKGAFIATGRLRKLVFEIHRWDNKTFAKEFKLDETRASRILNGKEEPSKQLMKSIYTRFRMKEGLFFFDPEAELITGAIIQRSTKSKK